MPFRLVAFLALTSFMFACQSNSSEGSGDADDQSNISTADCNIVLETQAVMVKWTAFKFNEKTAVGGRFDDVLIEGPKTGIDWREMAMNSSFTIKTNSVNSENPERDEKIQRHFFGQLIEGDKIEGLITNLDGSDFEGEAQIELSINGIAKEFSCSYMKTENLIVLNGNIDLVNWDGQAATDSLNTVCYDLHKGADGISKLWTTVDFEVQMLYGIDCPN